MVRIKLIVTGDMEKAALHASLRGFFPAEREGHEVLWDQPRKLQGATSFRLEPGGDPSPAMRDLAQAMLDEVLIGKRGSPADLVMVIDDVELGNVGQVEIVTQHFRDAVRRRLAEYEVRVSANARTQERHRELLQKKCSFHMLHPMVEAYLFGDSDALLQAGLPVSVRPRLVGPDVEQFQTDDPLWLPDCRTANISRQRTMPWWNHACHPKHYLEHLLQRGHVFYEETVHGVAALTDVRWGQVPHSAQMAPVIRALFEDLSEWFDVPSPLGVGISHPGLFPSRSVDRKGLLLRNL
jgi:hypothetical protein